MFRHVFRRLLPTALAVGLQAAEPLTPSLPLPPLRGELSGGLRLPKIPGLPAFDWRVQVQPGGEASLAFEIAATAPGLDGRILLTLPAGDAPGTWRLVQGKIDVADWWHFAADQAGSKGTPMPADFLATGALVVDGSGEWRGAELSGRLHLALAQGGAGSVAQKWSAAGIAFEGEIEFSPSRVSLRTLQLEVETLQAAALTVHRLLVEATGSKDGRLEINRAELDAFAGRIALAPFAFDPAAPAVKTLAAFSNIALGDIAVLMPQAIDEAHGRVAGRVAIEWSLKAGFGPGDGSVVVSPPEPATLRLAASPGLLTGRAPPRIALLPDSLGPLHRWVSIENPAYGMLRAIELGQAPLAVEGMKLRLFPDGPGGARSASLELAARPTGKGDVLEKVVFEINISGPLDQVLRLGLDDRAQIRVNADR